MSEEPKLAKLLLVMPATREQTFSAIKHIIIFLKNTRTRNELNHCFMFYVNYEKKGPTLHGTCSGGFHTWQCTKN